MGPNVENWPKLAMMSEQLIQHILMDAQKFQKSRGLGLIDETCKIDEEEQAMQRFHSIESEVFCKNRFTSQTSAGDCIMVVRLSGQMMQDEKHVKTMKQLRDTIKPILTVAYPRVRDGFVKQNMLKTQKSFTLRQLFPA